MMLDWNNIIDKNDLKAKIEKEVDTQLSNGYCVVCEKPIYHSKHANTYIMKNRSVFHVCDDCIDKKFFKVAKKKPENKKTKSGEK